MPAQPRYRRAVQFTSVQFTSVQFTSVQFTSVRLNTVRLNALQLASVQLLALPLFIVAVLCLPGCSPENKLGRQAVSGTITLNGTALDGGSILFAPEQPGGVSSGAEIEDGQYLIEAHQGLTPGTYTVRIYATDVQAEAVEPTLPGPGIKTQPERVPPKYNMRSQLKLEVDAAGPATFDLDIETK